MKKTLAIILAVFMLAIASLAIGAEKVTVGGVQVIKNPDRPAVADPETCPEGAYIDVIPLGDKGKVVVKGFKLFNNQVEVYGGNILAAVILDSNGEAYIPIKRRVNVAFLSTDGKYHYLALDVNDQVTGLVCTGPNTIIVDGTQGASITARAWVK